MNLNTLTDPVDIAALVKRRTPGYSLEAAFYTNQKVFDFDLTAIYAKHWLFCATEPELPDPGDYVTVEIGPYSVIIVRDDDEQVRAFHNVCRHRGSRLLKEPCGSVGNIVCPYHQWTYRVDGDLVYAEGQPSTFERKAFGLRPVHTRTLAGLIFVCLDENPPSDFDEVARIAEPYLAPFDIKSAKIAHQEDIEEAGNWKLVMENNRECLHCDTGHPELVSAYFPLWNYSEGEVAPRMRPVVERYQAASADLARTCALNQFPHQEHRDLEDRATAFRITHMPLDGAGTSFSPNGDAVCSKLMGTVPEPRFGDLALHLQPNAWFHFVSDHVVVFRVLPLAPNKSLLRTTWLVAPEAEEGIHYDRERLTAVWRATNGQDSAFVAETQRGVSNPGYLPGPYSLVEEDVDAFVNWYIGRARHYLDCRYDLDDHR